MPVPALKSIGARYGVPPDQMERFWSEAKARYDGDYAAVMGTVKRMAANYAKGRGRHLGGKG